MKDNYKLVCIDGRQGVRGDIIINKENCFSIEPGTMIIEIGDGRNSGTYRTDQFIDPVIYVGTKVFEDGDKYYLFKLKHEIECYLMYLSTGLELCCRGDDWARFYTPIFKILENKGIQR